MVVPTAAYGSEIGIIKTKNEMKMPTAENKFPKAINLTQEIHKN
jgi:hypothetical protein